MPDDILAQTIKGTVIPGYGEGRKLGFPTANLRLDAASPRPAVGVYICWVAYKSQAKVPGILVSGVHWETQQVPRVEVYLLDFSGDLYGLELEVAVGQKMRDVVTGLSPAELKKLIARDIATTRQLMAG